jgi:HemK-related putative methylase
MLDASMPSLLAGTKPRPLRMVIGRLLGLVYTITGKDRYDSFRLERVLDMPIVVMPSVANPKLLRTGAFLASQIDARLFHADASVLDMGTGSGICALVAARLARRVVAVDINPAAVRCAAVNAILNHLEKRVDLRQGDLFAPVGDERFDVVLFNPPFFLGVPKDDRDAAWRSNDAARRFAAGLGDHLKPGGAALVLLSSIGDACALFESELRSRGFRLEVFARRRFINETLTLLRATSAAAREPRP